MESLAVITTATDFNEGVENFLKSAKKYGYQPLILGWGQPWQGNVHKAKLAGRAIKQLREKHKLILCVDSYDMIFIDTPDSLIRSYQSFECPLVFGSEKYCYPDADKGEKHPLGTTPYRYLNGGGWIAESWYIDQIFDYIGFEKMDPALNDQDVWQKFFIDHSYALKLDYEQRIFQSMVLADDDLEYNDNNIRNKITGAYPKIIHGNGHWDMKKPLEWLNLRL